MQQPNMVQTPGSIHSVNPAASIAKFEAVFQGLIPHLHFIAGLVLLFIAAIGVLLASIPWFSKINPYYRWHGALVAILAGGAWLILQYYPLLAAMVHPHIPHLGH